MRDEGWVVKAVKTRKRRWFILCQRRFWVELREMRGYTGVDDYLTAGYGENGKFNS